MAETTFRKYYPQAAFVAMAGVTAEAAQFQTHLSTLAFSVPIVAAYNHGFVVAVEFGTLPQASDIAMLDAAVASFVAAPTTRAPISVLSAAATTAPNAAPVSKIDFTSPPLEAGTYSVTFTSQLKLTAGEANSSAKVVLTITFSGFPAFTQMFEWPFAITAPYNYAVTGVVTAGQTIRVQASIAKNGIASAVLGEISKARFTIDQLAAA
jgi:hypothetical protein